MTPQSPLDAASDETLHQRLRALRVERGGDGFRAALHGALVASGAPEAPRSWVQRIAGVLLIQRRALAWPLMGAACGALTFALLSGVGHAPGVARTASAPGTATTPAALGVGVDETALAHGQVAPLYRVPLSKVALIRINFAADVTIEDATFEVTLPDGLAFWSDGQKLPERTFRWPGRLVAGDNPMPIAVRGERPGVYKVKASAEVHDQRGDQARSQVINHEIVLAVQGDGA